MGHKPWQLPQQTPHTPRQETTTSSPACASAFSPLAPSWKSLGERGPPQPAQDTPAMVRAQAAPRVSTAKAEAGCTPGSGCAVGQGRQRWLRAGGGFHPPPVPAGVPGRRGGEGLQHPSALGPAWQGGTAGTEQRGPWEGAGGAPGAGPGEPEGVQPGRGRGQHLPPLSPFLPPLRSPPPSPPRRGAAGAVPSHPGARRAQLRSARCCRRLPMRVSRVGSSRRPPAPLRHGPALRQRTPGWDPLRLRRCGHGCGTPSRGCDPHSGRCTVGSGCPPGEGTGGDAAGAGRLGGDGMLPRG